MQQTSESSPQATVRVRLDKNISFSRREISGRSLYIAYHPGLGKYFQFGIVERRIAQLLDGHRDIRAILKQLERDGFEWRPEETAEFISRLVANKMATVMAAGDTAHARPRSEPQTETIEAAQTPKRLARLLRLLSMTVSQRLPLIDGRRLAGRLESRLGVMFDFPGMAVWAVLVVSGLLLVFTRMDALSTELRRIFSPDSWLVMIVLWCLAKLLHEAGHAVAAHHRGVRVGKAGIIFFLMAPLAYVDVTDAWKLPSRWHRVQIALAGVYVELAIAALAAWAWYLLPPCTAQHLAAQLFLITGPASLLVNANPLLRLDGYYVLSDLTEIPNLRMHGRKQLAGYIEWLLFHIPRPASLLVGWRRRFATVHAACSVVFQIFWMAGLIYAVSLWARGLGCLLAGSALLLWVLVPLSRWICKIWSMEAPDGVWPLNHLRRRLLMLAAVLMFLVQLSVTATSPLDRRVPVLVRFHDEQIARASSDAFVRNVLVRRGEHVYEGAILMKLEDRRLRLKRDELADDLELAASRSIQLRRNNQLAQAMAESEHAASIRRQLGELDEQLGNLTIRAKREGLVTGRQLDRLEGRFVKRGEELVRVVDPQDKELLVAIPESDSQAYQHAALRNRPAEVRLRGGRRFSAVPTTLHPRARRSLLHPAFASTAGGPIAVEASSDSDEPMRAVQPHLQSLVPLNPLVSAEVHAGQVGSLRIADDRSLVARLLESTRARFDTR